MMKLGHVGNVGRSDVAMQSREEIRFADAPQWP